jgi:hypothetical protein
MYHIVTIYFPQCRPSHLLCRFLGHEKALDPRYERKVLEYLLGNLSLPLLTITGVNLKVPRGITMDTIFGVHMLFSK